MLLFVVTSVPHCQGSINLQIQCAKTTIALPQCAFVILKHNSTCSTSPGNKDVVSTFLQMVIYIEACESGSMFDDLLKTDINVFATTAANPDESSYACYYDDKRETYLGDRYSVSWLEDSDKV